MISNMPRSNSLKATHSGFTIIEILIVLAIAGLIMLIVFLAVPALERNARDYRRNHDAALLASERQSYDENEDTSGDVPSASETCNTGAPDWPTLCNTVIPEMTYYLPANITIIANDSDGAPPPVPTFPTDWPSSEQVWSESYMACNDTGTGAETTDEPNIEATLYTTEGSGGLQPKCIEETVFSSSGGD